LGWWNLSEACRQIGEWRAACPANANLIISVNLSAKQFLQPNLVADIANLLREIKLPPNALKLEITESTVMKDPAGAVEMLQQIKSLGVRLAIDDFGTGYSSLSYLHRFPLDTLKIDRSFISSMDDDGDGMEIARTILPMAKNLRLDVVAEGVETSEQFELLKKYNCAFGQGYYFSRPLAADGIATLLKCDLAWQNFVQTK
jgi:EAL domain-containing protein (putative c-di-GMP-specific phosphodiesterase class I)